jgi:homocysteine S-methyltransferase
VHESYFAAGADVATSASYQASIQGFAQRGLSAEESLSLMRLSVELADQARRNTGGEGMVAGSVGPYGAMLADGSEYRGAYGVSLETLAAFHRPRLQALIEAGADLLAIETCPSAIEALLVLELLEHWPGVRAWVSFTCRDDERTSEGQLIGEAVAPSLRAGRWSRWASIVLPAPGRWIAHSDAGRDQSPARGLSEYRGDMGRRVPRMEGSPDTFDPARDVPRWIDLGARWIGGCCRTTPGTIFEIRRAVSREP